MSDRIAALCVERQSIYKRFRNVDCYDINRDARTFNRDVPVIAHPPCRAWSAFCAHQSKPDEGERELGLWCCEVLRQCGGVVEQPAHSRLFGAAGLPPPGESDGDLKTIQVMQAWWGYKTRKATWLCFSKCDVPEIPYRLHDARGDRRRMAVMSKHQRSRTTAEFAWWLIQAARQCTQGIYG